MNHSFFPLLLLSAASPYSGCRRECLSELAGTYLLVLIGPASVIIASLLPALDALSSLLLICSAFSGTVAMVILLLGKYSVHLNPAVTLAHGLSDLMPWRFFLPYVCFQLVGALLAGFTLKSIFGSAGSTASLGATKLAIGIDSAAGLALEGVGTFLLSISALTAGSYIQTRPRQAALVGTTLFALIFVVGPLTGASFNPARSLGPSFASSYFDNQYVYWVGPAIGAGVAGLAFRVVRGSNGRRRQLGTVHVC